MSLFSLFPLGATASLRFVSSLSPTLVQQPKVSDTANGVGAEVTSTSPTLVQQHKVSYIANGVGAEALDRMGPRADESVSGVGRKWRKGRKCDEGQEVGEGRK